MFVPEKYMVECSKGECPACGSKVPAFMSRCKMAKISETGCIRGLFLAAICLVFHPSFAANPASAISVAIPIINKIQPTSPSFLCVFHPPKNLPFIHSAIFSKTRPINTSAPPVVAQIKSQNWPDDEIAEEKRKLDASWCKCICFLVFIFANNFRQPQLAPMTDHAANHHHGFPS